MPSLASGSGLAPWAAHDDRSRGRVYPEPPAHPRSEFQRDRDRIIHCGAFRRLMYKTQVFVNHEGDMYRTRLTHSLEVSQIGRSVAVALGLNEHLTEAICLAHDLGHTPFGHAGQEALNDCMQDYGGFEHNLQSLRVVDKLEEKYAGFPGLNLCFETREGILKHCSRRNARELGELGERFLNRQQPGLEAQLANLADEIAYNNHDVDDGLRAGMISIEQLCELEMFNSCYREVVAEYPALVERTVIHETVRCMINHVVSDLIENTRKELDRVSPVSIDDVRQHGRSIAGMSEGVGKAHHELKRFLRRTLYSHERVRRMTDKADRIMRSLFSCYMSHPDLLSERFGTDSEGGGEEIRARAVADYIAGMTDRFALGEYQRLIEPGDDR
ncbi:MAG: deoxyguanosinetriphosphate triphosphohydrolase [Gammaproteobacteria bacterium]|nr:deoxyguanosinetriphosphate triphosphohydrolase [Pseudomonadota bacterium]MCZ6537329.1 deoxyguanosinetriphosphate triphosphohydrolase [Gammaproteobacteria bacterium]MCZ6686265.1 deoxyguanosinetriphosphate triphosphohydrolase [Gammaproteobacteria bacterium]MCZ6762068.1 deoxyguanosinetriphosphate triphosphohydrolase [Gammaproteobacteria bacterium]MCZ6880248.1 deoxyguanosinetriphosphate triphosphohydrolase [Gammaproteobacteria bacterium]